MLDVANRAEKKHVYPQQDDDNAKAGGAVMRERDGVSAAGGAEEQVRNITRCTLSVRVVLQCTTRSDINTLPVGFLAMIRWLC